MQDRLYSYSNERKYGTDPLVTARSTAGSKSSHDDNTQEQTAVGLKRARRPMTPGAVSEGLLDWVVAMSSLYFVVFAALAYQHRGEPAESDWGKALLKAAQYGPTILPIVFSAIIARFILVLAHTKLEKGTRVLTLEHLLHSRTVFSTFTASINLRSFHIVTPMLILLWALSPVGGQASLRMISTEPQTTIIPNNFSYLAYASTFTNEGVGSASAEKLTPINAGFTGALMSSSDAKRAHQDPYGNIKVPVYDSLHAAVGPEASEWRDVPSSGDITWSALMGIPVANIPTDANSTFRLNTGYMMTDCQTRGDAFNGTFRSLADILPGPAGGWSGADFAINAGIVTYYGAPAATFVFRSLASADFNEARPLTVANCTAYMHYIEQDVRCEGRSCRSVRARPAPSPAAHVSSVWDNAVVKANLTEYTPLNGLAQNDAMVTNFFKNFINSTNPSASCDTSFCAIMSGVEGYLVNPDNAFGIGSTQLIWPLGDELISQRMGQLMNTYWLNSIAPSSMTGNFSGAASGSYNTDSVIGTREETRIVIKVNIGWMTLLLIASAVMVICGMSTVVMSMRRRGPDILDNFTALLRDNPYVRDPGYSSMDDAYDQAKRLRNTIVRLGDVKPDAEVGHVAIAASGPGGLVVGPLSPKKLYD